MIVYRPYVCIVEIVVFPFEMCLRNERYLNFFDAN